MKIISPLRHTFAEFIPPPAGLSVNQDTNGKLGTVPIFPDNPPLFSQGGWQVYDGGMEGIRWGDGRYTIGGWQVYDRGMAGIRWGGGRYTIGGWQVEDRGVGGRGWGGGIPPLLKCVICVFGPETALYCVWGCLPDAETCLSSLRRICLWHDRRHGARRAAYLTDMGLERIRQV
jgi:hypothetical protein